MKMTLVFPKVTTRCLVLSPVEILQQESGSNSKLGHM